jgi:hypothetical protein
MEIAFGESGADREADFDFDDAMEKAYEEYRVAEAKYFFSLAASHFERKMIC